MKLKFMIDFIYYIMKTDIDIYNIGYLDTNNNEWYKFVTHKRVEYYRILTNMLRIVLQMCIR